MKTILFAIISFLAASSFLSAQDSVADEELFSGDTFITEEKTVEKEVQKDTLLVSDQTRIGGRFHLTTETTADTADPGNPSSTIDLFSQIYLDARPLEDFRVFAKGILEYQVTADSSTDPNELFELRELFSDFNIEDIVFIRAGKQTITWGTGYFYSPADIINLESIDPEDPDAEREGPVAVKLHLPISTANVYLYTILDPMAADQFAVAPKFEFIFDKTEIGIGGFYRLNGIIAGMTTISTSIGDVNLFGEAVVLAGSSRVFLERTTDLITYPFGLRPFSQPDTVFFQSTVGFTYSYVDEFDNFNISFSGQYYYNGTGYDDQSLIADNKPAIMALMGSGELDPADLTERGIHYGAAQIMWREMFASDFSAGIFWMSNFSDLSGMINYSVHFSPNDYLQFTLGVRQTYGEPGEEYTPIEDTLGIYFKTSIGTGNF
ncbi:MAG: hypothetical protein JW904_01885 [Spirochaetales bacterium]|nr:hypothetical protein [Spirochaetales bacterium]